jgi:uncharacterized small protein (DUF1192 family)
MAIMVWGSVLIAPRSAPNCRVRKPPSVDRAAAWVDSRFMDLEELFPSKPGDPLVQLVKQDLDPLSVEELEERILTLEGEIERVRAKIDFAVNHRASAEALFKK